MQRTTMHFGAVLRGIVAVIALVAVATGCALPFEWAGAIPGSHAGTGNSGDEDTGDETGNDDGSTDDPRPIVQPITLSGPSFTLAWDDDSSETVSYTVYWRNRGATSWQLLASDLAEPEYTVSTEILSHGSYEFAVSSVSSDGQESDLHESLDEDAEPEPWYLEWSA